jgi:AGZA family xanthine/uracil permease-like MFS transporter
MNRYGWVGRGDINAFFGLMIDNVAVMVLLVSLVGKATVAEAMAGQGAFTADFVMTYMIPGTALGVFVGDILYTWMAFRLARRTGRHVTAMPLGLDTPSTFGVAFLILMPSLQSEYARLQNSGMSAAESARWRCSSPGTSGWPCSCSSACSRCCSPRSAARSATGFRGPASSVR